MREFPTLNLETMGTDESLYYYKEAIYLIRERELREVWLAIAFPAFGNKEAPPWDDFKEKYLPRYPEEKPKGKSVGKPKPKMTTFKGVDLARINRN